jgi:glycosyltransferase involved in cell wall biosynthesis
LGGIETYVHDIAEELRFYGYTVRIVGGQWWQTRWSRLWSMVLSLCNIPFALRLRSIVQKFKPDVIWYHSVLRYVGWLPLAASGRLSKSYVMIHDLWYIHPYPHRVYEESNLPSSAWILAFVRSLCSRNPLVWTAVAVKWCMVRLLRRQFDRMKAILVPSWFMQKLVSIWTTNTIKTLPHFIQK